LGRPPDLGRLNGGRSTTVTIHRTRHDADQGPRHTPRSMHPDRRPEMNRFARHT
jgi:hypothetical protein